MGAVGSHSATALHKAREFGHVACVKLLLKHGADANAFCIGGLTVLHLVCRLGHVAYSRALLKWGAGVGAVFNHGNAMLHAASLSG